MPRKKLEEAAGKTAKPAAQRRGKFSSFRRPKQVGAWEHARGNERGRLLIRFAPLGGVVAEEGLLPRDAGDLG